MSKSARIIGPERRGAGWRVREIAPNGETETFLFALEDEQGARNKVRAFRQEATADRSIGATVTEYIEHLRRFGGSKSRNLRDSGLKTRTRKLVTILQLLDREESRRNRGKRIASVLYNDRPLEALTAAAAQRLYSECVKEYAAATQHGFLVAAQEFGAFCATEGYLPANPFSAVKREGDANEGKPKLRLDEARKFIMAAYSDPHPLGGLAAAMMLTLGTRSHEILTRSIRDLDDYGRVLVIPRSKTDAGKRRLQIPPVLRAHLRKLTEGQAPEALVFRGMTNGTLLGHVKRLCEVAGVPMVCAHGLRGTWGDITVEIEGKVDSAAKTMGHASAEITRRAYLSAGTEQSVKAAFMESKLLEIVDESAQENELELAEREAREADERLTALRMRAASRVALELGSTAKTSIPDRDPAN